MSCSQTLYGIALDCATSQGGIKKAYIANYVEGAFDVLTTGSTPAIPVSVTGVSSSVTWQELNFRKQTGSMTSTLNVDEANGINYVSTELALRFARQDTTKRLAVASMALGGIMAVVVDANDEWYALGVSEPMFPSAGGAETGTAKTDANQYTVTLTDEYESYPLHLTADAITVVKAHIAGE